MPCTSVRLIVLLALGILLAPLSSDAQGPAQVRRIGVLAGGSPDPERLRNLEAFRHSLRDLGWVEGQNLAMEVRWAEGRPERVPELAAELVRLQVEVMVAGGGASRPAQDATRTIPIVVVALGGDPVAQGFVASLGRPGGNITGTTSQHVDLSGKRLELLKALVPEVSRIAFLVTPAHRGGALLQETQRAAQALGVVELQVLEVSSPDEFESAFSAMHAAGAGALLLPTSAVVFERHHRDITALALQSRLPTMYPWRMYPEAGGLMSYGPSLRALWQRTATYVDKLLKGAKPADLPVEQPMQFELVLNLKTAQALGITFPPTLLMLADEVIK